MLPRCWSPCRVRARASGCGGGDRNRARERGASSRRRLRACAVRSPLLLLVTLALTHSCAGACALNCPAGQVSNPSDGTTCTTEGARGVTRSPARASWGGGGAAEQHAPPHATPPARARVEEAWCQDHDGMNDSGASCVVCKLNVGCTECSWGGYLVPPSADNPIARCAGCLGEGRLPAGTGGSA